MRAGADDDVNTLLLAPAFCFFVMEVIALGAKTAEAMQTRGVRRAHAGGLVSKAQAPARSQGECRISRLVCAADMDAEAAPGTALAGTVLPRVRKAGTADAGYGRRPHQAVSRRLGAVCQRDKPPKPLQTLSRPQDRRRTDGKTERKTREFRAMSLRPRSGACRGGAHTAHPHARAAP